MNGELIYKTPQTPYNRQMFVVLIWSVLIICLSIPGVWFIISPFTVGTPPWYSVIGLILIGIGIFVGVGISQDLMYPHFEIYTNGITSLAFHKRPFSKQISKYRFFIEWSDIICFDRYGYTDKRPQIVIYVDKSKILWGRITYFHKKKEVIDTLINELRKHEIKEIPVNCQYCGKETTGTERCIYCGKKRF